MGLALTICLRSLAAASGGSIEDRKSRIASMVVGPGGRVAERRRLIMRLQEQLAHTVRDLLGPRLPSAT
jgi:hypothetical protein